MKLRVLLISTQLVCSGCSHFGSCWSNCPGGERGRGLWEQGCWSCRRCGRLCDGRSCKTASGVAQARCLASPRRREVSSRPAHTSERSAPLTADTRSGHVHLDRERPSPVECVVSGPGARPRPSKSWSSRAVGEPMRNSVKRASKPALCGEQHIGPIRDISVEGKYASLRVSKASLTVGAHSTCTAVPCRVSLRRNGSGASNIGTIDQSDTSRVTTQLRSRFPWTNSTSALIQLF